MFSQYEIRARLVPALICAVPFLAFGYFFLASIDASFSEFVLAQVVGGVSMMAAVFLLLAFAARHVGMWLQDLMFKHGTNFPTTSFLLDADVTFSEERKRQIRAKVVADFDVDLSDYTTDTASSRRRIGEAVSHIRKQFFGKPGLTLQRNIEFGLAKNLAGGSILALVVSVIIVGLSTIVAGPVLLKLGIVMALIYVVMVVFGLIAMRTNANRYAAALFEEYLRT